MAQITGANSIQPVVSGGLGLNNSSMPGNLSAQIAKAAAANQAVDQQNESALRSSVQSNLASQQAAAAQAQQASLYSQYGDPNALNGQIQGYQGDLGRIDSKYQVDLNNLTNDYQSQRNSLNQQADLGQRNYNAATQQNLQSFTNQRNKIDTQTRGNANALQRLLGIAGAGNSSAALEAAPYAAALSGSMDLNDAQTTYGNTQLGLDTKLKDQKRQYEDSLESLNVQRYRQENNARADAANTRLTSLGQIADVIGKQIQARGGSTQAALAAQAPYRDQINALKNEIIGYGKAYPTAVLQAQAIDTAPYTLNDYAKGRAATPQGTEIPGGSAIDSSYLGILNGNKKDAYGQTIA